MRITTRIALGLVLLSGLTVAVLAYQVRSNHHLQAINEELARTNVEAARLSIRLVQDFEGVREFASKALVLEDPDYLEQWGAWETSVTDDLGRLLKLDLGPSERQAVREIETGWVRYLVEFAPLRSGDREWPRGEQLFTALDRIDDLTLALRAGAEEVIDANQSTVSAQAAASARAGARAARVSWIAAFGAVGLAILICVILYLSISGPLQRLTRGTREIAEGRFDHRLPEGGGDELAALAQDFNRMAARLDELEDMKRDFVSHVSHELKGPLAAIHETILVLLEEIPGPLNGKQLQLLTLSHQSATRLSGMISNLLEISRMESGALSLERSATDPLALTRDVAEELSPLARERGIEVEIIDHWSGNAPGPFHADADRLREVISNLTGNALKFAPREGSVTIEVECVRDDPEPALRLTVEDDGPGIPEEHREGVFEKFYQVRRGVRIHGQGVGLGLSICRNIVDAHGGSIRVDEGSLGGARFIVTLPWVEGAPAPGSDTFTGNGSMNEPWPDDPLTSTPSAAAHEG
jgi:two-component system, NtrC family, sensor histidine kinase GlrK